MIRALPLLALALVAGPAWAQADLFGVVADAETAGPIAGAAVTLEAPTGALRGRAAGDEGQFAFLGLLAGEYVLRVTAVGYEPALDTLAVADGDRLNVGVELTPRTALLGAVEVESAQAEVLREPGLTRLRPADLAALPAGDPGGDLAAALLTQPGVSTVGDRGGQLSIRGGTPTQNLVLVDGIPVFQPFHLLGGYSALPAGVVRSADLYTGGWPARFGGRIASVVDVSGRTAHKRRVGGAATVSPVLVGAELEIPVVPGDVSVLTSVRQSVAERSGEVLGIDLPYGFVDAYGKVHARLDATTTLQATALYASDDGDLGLNGSRTTTRSEAAGGQFFSISSAFAAAIDISIYWSRFTTTFAPVGAPLRHARAETFGGRFGYVYYIGPHTIRTGLQSSSYLFNYAFRPEAQTRENTSEGSFFVDADFDLGGGVQLEPGLRVQTFPAQAQPMSVEPRLLASWSDGNLVLRAAGGVYRQEIIGLQDQRDVGDVFTAWTTTQQGFPVPRAVHGLVGIEGGIGSVRVGVEGYAKALSGQTILLDGQLRSTNGDARGVEVTAALRRPGLRLDARYGAQSLTYRDDVRSYQPPFHRPHSLALDGRIERGPFAVAAALRLTSGRPYTRVVGAYLDLSEALERGIPVSEAGGPAVVLFGPETYGERTPAYARLDLSAEWATRIPGGRAVVQAALLNATDRANVFYYDPLLARQVDQLPLLPTLGLRVEIE